MNPTNILLAGIIAVALLSGCASYEAHQEKMAQYKKENEQYKAKFDKEFAERRAQSKRFCALSPVARDAQIAAQWEHERHRPGSPWQSYGHMRVAAQQAWGC